jgi:hypothetical protein
MAVYNSPQTNLSLYVNGTLVGSTNLAAQLATNNLITFGASADNSLPCAGGSFAQPVIYRIPLSANEVKQIYSGTYPQKSLEFYSDLNSTPMQTPVFNRANTTAIGNVGCVCTNAGAWQPLQLRGGP